MDTGWTDNLWTFLTGPLNLNSVVKYHVQNFAEVDTLVSCV